MAKRSQEGRLISPPGSGMYEKKQSALEAVEEAESSGKPGFS